MHDTEDEEFKRLALEDPDLALEIANEQLRSMREALDVKADSLEEINGIIEQHGIQGEAAETIGIVLEQLFLSGVHYGDYRHWRDRAATAINLARKRDTNLSSLGQAWKAKREISEPLRARAKIVIDANPTISLNRCAGLVAGDKDVSYVRRTIKELFEKNAHGEYRPKPRD